MMYGRLSQKLVALYAASGTQDNALVIEYDISYQCGVSLFCRGR